MLDQLTPNQQHMLMELLIRLAQADGEIVDIEEEVLRQYAELVDVDFDDLSGDLSLQEILPAFDTSVSRVAAVQELFRLAHIDGFFSEDEKRVIRQVADLLGMPDSLVNEIDAWVVDGLRWVWRGEELVEQAERMMG